MAKQVVGLFDTTQDAHSAVSALRESGFAADDISVIVNNASGEYDTYDGEGGTEAAEGAGAGATGGAIVGGLGGLLVGLGALAIPGIGPVIAAGTLGTALATTAVGAGLGAAAGGLVGALVGAGIPEEDANIYAEGIRQGGALVTVQVADDSNADRAADILDRYNVVDIDERGATYRSSGWSRFDDTAPATGTSGVDSPKSEWEESSKVGTAGGAVAGAATGAAVGSVGGPVGTVVGGVAGAVTGAGVGAAGDAAGEAASDAATGEDDWSRRSTTSTTPARSGTALGSATDTGTTTSTTDRTDYSTVRIDDTTPAADTTASTFASGSRTVDADQGEVAIPIVEEDVRVGKREVDAGGVRVTTHVEETPVNEQVTLRDERVTVDRRPVDRPVDAGTATDAFREGTFEVREHDEEAVVAKEARVVEEVVIGKEVDQRTENIQDTVRRTDVDVEQIPGQTTRSDYTDTTRASTTDYGTTTGTRDYTSTSTDSAKSEWEESSKVGTAGGAVAGAATGAAIGSVGGPVGTVVGGVAGAVTGAGVGAAGDAAGEAVADGTTGEDDRPESSTSSTRYEDISRTSSNDEGAIESTLGDAGASTERATGLDLDRSGGVGDRDRRDNY